MGHIVIIFLSLSLSDLTTCKVNAWYIWSCRKTGYLREGWGVKKIYKNGRIGVWCENYVYQSFMYKKKEKVAPVCCVNNRNSLKSIFSLGPVFSSVICSLALTSPHLFWTLNAITEHTGHHIPFSLAHNETLRHPTCFFLPSFRWN